jgi:ACS family D-galactonate transporter-like MFS transporter
MENAKPTNVRWGVFFALFVLCSINYVDRAVLSLCMPAIQKDLHLDPALVGVILSAFFWGYASMQIPAGWLTDRFRTDKLIIISAILWGVFQIISGFAATTRVFMFLRVLLGMSESTIYPGGTRLMSVWLTPEERGRGSSLLDSGSLFGNAIGGPIVIVFSAWMGGWRGALIGAGLVTLFVSAFCWRFLKGSPDTNPRVNQAECEYIKKALAKEIKSSKNANGLPKQNTGIRDYLKSLNFWCMMIGFYAMDSYWFGLMTWGPSYLSATHHLNIKALGGAVMVIFGVAAIAELIGGLITDKWRKSGASVDTVIRTLLGLLAMGMMISMYCLSKTTSLVEVCVCLAVGASLVKWAAMLFFVIPSAITQREHLGTVTGAMNCSGNIGGIVTPICVGLIVSFMKSYDWALMMFIGFGAIVLLSALLFNLNNKIEAGLPAQVRPEGVSA